MLPPPIFPWILDAAWGIILFVNDYRLSCQSLRFFGGLYNGDIVEILGIDMRVVYRNTAQVEARFSNGLSS